MKVTTDQPEIKKRICEHILRSGWLYNVVDPLDMEKWYRAWQLGLQDPQFLKHLKDDKSTCKTPFTYPSEAHKVHLMSGDIVVEKLFLCLGRTSRTRRITDFYISEEYNVNLTYEDYIAGRFLFAKIESKPEKFVVTCLAEEPAIVIEDSREEMRKLYLDSRRHLSIGIRALFLISTILSEQV